MKNKQSIEERKPHRQICSICHREYSIDFKVPNKIWELVTHHSQRENLICLDCFTRMADTRFVQWDKEISFYPISLVTHIKIIGFELDLKDVEIIVDGYPTT